MCLPHKELFNTPRKLGSLSASARGHPEGLKALSARAVRAASNHEGANQMRAGVLSGPIDNTWEAGPRSAVEFKEAATYYEQAAALCHAPLGKAQHADDADWCRSEAEAM